MDKKIKLLLLLLNKKGKHINLKSEMKYSEEYNNMYTKYKLVFWHQKDTGSWYCKEVEFNNKTTLLKYLVEVKGDINE